MITGINSEDRVVQATFAKHLEERLGWESIYAWNQETFGLAETRRFRISTSKQPRTGCSSTSGT